MSVRQFTWTWAKLSVVVAHLADQSRFNNAFSGQDKEDAYVRDTDYYNGHPVFATMEVNRRHLHRKDGIIVEITVKQTRLGRNSCSMAGNRLSAK